MENQIVVNQQNLSKRDIGVITEEIIGLKNQAKTTFVAYACEIGKRLYEAKNKLNHGEWGAWLKEKVDFSQSTANNYMNLYDEYGDGSAILLGMGANSQAFANLDYSKAIKLLALPKEEREEFVVENDIENKSVRETDKLIKEHKKALEEKARLEEENARLKGYQKEADEAKKMALNAQTALSDKQAELDKLKEALDELENNSAEPQISDEELRKIEKEAKKEAEQQAEAKFNVKLMGERAKLDEERAKLEAEIAAIKAEKDAAEARAKEANDKMAEYEKQVKLQDPLIAKFKTIFEDFQDKGFNLLEIIENTDKETSIKFRAALNAFLEKMY